MILAIDDDPGRYQHLLRLLPALNLERHCCPGKVEEALQHPALRAVLLDYDLAHTEHPELKSHAFFAAILSSRRPVIIVSANHQARPWMHKQFHGNVPCAVLPVTEPDPELKWIGQLYLWGAL